MVKIFFDEILHEFSGFLFWNMVYCYRCLSRCGFLNLYNVFGGTLNLAQSINLNLCSVSFYRVPTVCRIFQFVTAGNVT